MMSFKCSCILFIVVTILLEVTLIASCEESHVSPGPGQHVEQERQGAINKIEMKYLACLIGCNVACPATCFYKAAKMDTMLKCIQKCGEHHNL